MRSLIAALLCAVCGPALSEPLDVTGTWNAENRFGNIQGRVRIADCGNGTPCGVLVWFDPTRTDQRLDAHNPDPGQRLRPLVGTTVITGLERHGTGWRRGRIYNPEDGKTFACALQLAPGGNQLRVTGCLGPVCQTKIWTRVSIPVTQGHGA